MFAKPPSNQPGSWDLIADASAKKDSLVTMPQHLAHDSGDASTRRALPAQLFDAL